MIHPVENFARAGREFLGRAFTAPQDLTDLVVVFGSERQRDGRRQDQQERGPTNKQTALHRGDPAGIENN